MGNVDQKAEELWDVYRNAVGGKSVTGQDLPQWADINNDTVRDGWRALATHVLEGQK